MFYKHSELDHINQNFVTLSFYLIEDILTKISFIYYDDFWLFLINFAGTFTLQLLFSFREMFVYNKTPVWQKSNNRFSIVFRQII